LRRPCRPRLIRVVSFHWHGDGVPPITAVLADDSCWARERRQEHVQMTPQFILAVAAGGALGSVARYLVGIGSGKLLGTDFPRGHAHNQRDRLVFDWRVRRPVRSQMGPIAGNADIPDSRHLWWLHDVFHILSGRLLLDRTWTDVGIIHLHGSVGGAVRWCPDCRAKARSGALLNGGR
jgi:hypothetical protein